MKKFILHIIILLACTSCEKREPNNGNSKAIGHGGMGIGYSYPINSFESIQNCLSIGAHGTEIDVQMTSDSVLVAFHDQFLDNKTSSSGSIYTKTWQEINNLEYNYPPYTNYKVVTLDQLFSNLINTSEYTFFLDCKNFNPDDSPAYVRTYTNAIFRFIDKFELSDNIIIEQKRISIIEEMKSQRPEIKIFKYGDYTESLNTAIEYNLEGLTVPIDNVSDDVINEVYSYDMEIAVFNCHSKERNNEALENNIDYIQSDRIRHLVRILK